MAYTLTTTTPSTILDPGDPALGSSYADGVERASRVKKKKQLVAGVGNAPIDAAAPPTALTPEDLRMLRDIGAPLEVNPGDLERYRKMYGGRTPQSTILGG